MIDQVIDLINNNLDGIHEDEIILGLAQRVYRTSGDSIEYMPGIVGMDGEAIYAGIDDVRSIMIYHKTITGAFSYLPRSGYGDSRENEDSFSLGIIAVWDTRKIKLHSPDVLLLLRGRMPQQITSNTGINRILVTPTSAILNSKQIFESEYTVAENYLLPLYINFAQLNYTVSIKYDPKCIEKCINCKS